MSAPAVGVLGGCFLCNRRSEQVVWRENGFDGRLCECGTLYSEKDGTPFEVEDVATESHPISFYALPSGLKARWMAAHCDGTKLVEVGCGEPSFLEAAKSLGFQIHGIEPHARRAREASRRLGISIERAFIEDDTLPPASFDIVYHCDLLSHFPDPLRALGSMTRLLRPNGALCFEVGILGGISPWWYRVVGELGLGRHRFLYSLRSLRELFDRAKLRVVHRRDFGLAPEVLLHRPAGLFTHRVVRPVLSALRVPDSGARAERLQNSIDYFARYRLGSIAPPVGPATAFIVAKPSAP